MIFICILFSSNDRFKANIYYGVKISLDKYEKYSFDIVEKKKRTSEIQSCKKFINGYYL